MALIVNLKLNDIIMLSSLIDGLIITHLFLDQNLNMESAYILRRIGYIIYFYLFNIKIGQQNNCELIIITIHYTNVCVII